MRKEDRMAAEKRQGRPDDQMQHDDQKTDREEERMKGRAKDESQKPERKEGKLPLPD